MADYGDIITSMSGFGPEWVFATLIGVTLAARSPAILKVVLTYLNERERVKAKIAADTRRLDQALSQRLEKEATRREGRK